MVKHCSEQFRERVTQSRFGMDKMDIKLEPSCFPCFSYTYMETDMSFNGNIIALGVNMHLLTILCCIMVIQYTLDYLTCLTDWLKLPG